MEDYEINVLKRNGGWKRLSQKQNVDSITNNKNQNFESSKNDLTINIKDEITDKDKNIFKDFNDINVIIDKLKHIENEKSVLISKLSSLEKNFIEKKNITSERLKKVNEEYELFEKAINLIQSLKKA